MHRERAMLTLAVAFLLQAVPQAGRSADTLHADTPRARHTQQLEGVQLTAGSYNTSRGSAVYQTGLSPQGFAAYVRASGQRTDGYRYNSGNRSRSAFATGGWFGTSNIVKLTLLAGLSANEQAYLASPL